MIKAELRHNAIEALQLQYSHGVILYDITDPIPHFTVMTPRYGYRIDFTAKFTFISLVVTPFTPPEYTVYCSFILPFFLALFFLLLLLSCSSPAHP